LKSNLFLKCALLIVGSNSAKQCSSADSGSYVFIAYLPIKPGEESQNNRTKVLRDILASFATSCPMYRRRAQIPGATGKNTLSLTI
jgi:hypothetical protein